ncbi:hypothetical protein A0H81_01943 [Grifola frondosa]|uniref:Uncharacterized protein n=1 Tax=Grifola frondosa TaxID=5627 RepID=A0A1C7MP03_GRIFR|nr:hypothetical protein A0H81_01943 [Grifola frondosa]
MMAPEPNSMSLATRWLTPRCPPKSGSPRPNQASSHSHVPSPISDSIPTFLSGLTAGYQHLRLPPSSSPDFIFSYCRDVLINACFCSIIHIVPRIPSDPSSEIARTLPFASPSCLRCPPARALDYDSRPSIHHNPPERNTAVVNLPLVALATTEASNCTPISDYRLLEARRALPTTEYNPEKPGLGTQYLLAPRCGASESTFRVACIVVNVKLPAEYRLHLEEEYDMQRQSVDTVTPRGTSLRFSPGRTDPVRHRARCPWSLGGFDHAFDANVSHLLSAARAISLFSQTTRELLFCSDAARLSDPLPFCDTISQIHLGTPEFACIGHLDPCPTYIALDNTPSACWNIRELGHRSALTEGIL